MSRALVEGTPIIPMGVKDFATEMQKLSEARAATLGADPDRDPDLQSLKLDLAALEVSGGAPEEISRLKKNIADPDRLLIKALEPELQIIIAARKASLEALAPEDLAGANLIRQEIATIVESGYQAKLDGLRGVLESSAQIVALSGDRRGEVAGILGDKIVGEVAASREGATLDEYSALVSANEEYIKLQGLYQARGHAQAAQAWSDVATSIPEGIEYDSLTVDQKKEIAEKVAKARGATAKTEEKSDVDHDIAKTIADSEYIKSSLTGLGALLADPTQHDEAIILIGEMKTSLGGFLSNAAADIFLKSSEDRATIGGVDLKNIVTRDVEGIVERKVSPVGGGSPGIEFLLEESKQRGLVGELRADVEGPIRQSRRDSEVRVESAGFGISASSFVSQFLGDHPELDDNKLSSNQQAFVEAFDRNFRAFYLKQQVTSYKPTYEGSIGKNIGKLAGSFVPGGAVLLGAVGKVADSFAKSMSEDGHRSAQTFKKYFEQFSPDERDGVIHSVALELARQDKEFLDHMHPDDVVKLSLTHFGKMASAVVSHKVLEGLPGDIPVTPSEEGEARKAIVAERGNALILAARDPEIDGTLVGKAVGSAAASGIRMVASGASAAVTRAAGSPVIARALEDVQKMVSSVSSVDVVSVASQGAGALVTGAASAVTAAVGNTAMESAGDTVHDKIIRGAAYRMVDAANGAAPATVYTVRDDHIFGTRSSPPDAIVDAPTIGGDAEEFKRSDGRSAVIGGATGGATLHVHLPRWQASEMGVLSDTGSKLETFKTHVRDRLGKDLASLQGYLDKHPEAGAGLAARATGAMGRLVDKVVPDEVMSSLVQFAGLIDAENVGKNKAAINAAIQCFTHDIPGNISPDEQDARLRINIELAVERMAAAYEGVVDKLSPKSVPDFADAMVHYGVKGMVKQGFQDKTREAQKIAESRDVGDVFVAASIGGTVEAAAKTSGSRILGAVVETFAPISAEALRSRGVASEFRLKDGHSFQEATSATPQVPSPPPPPGVVPPVSQVGTALTAKTVITVADLAKLPVTTSDGSRFVVGGAEVQSAELDARISGIGSITLREGSAAAQKALPEGYAITDSYSEIFKTKFQEVFGQISSDITWKGDVNRILSNASIDGTNPIVQELSMALNEKYHSTMSVLSEESQQRFAEQVALRAMDTIYEKEDFRRALKESADRYSKDDTDEVRNEALGHVVGGICAAVDVGRVIKHHLLLPREVYTPERTLLTFRDGMKLQDKDGNDVEIHTSDNNLFKGDNGYNLMSGADASGARTLVVPDVFKHSEPCNAEGRSYAEMFEKGQNGEIRRAAIEASKVELATLLTPELTGEKLIANMTLAGVVLSPEVTASMDAIAAIVKEKLATRYAPKAEFVKNSLGAEGYTARMSSIIPKLCSRVAAGCRDMAGTFDPLVPGDAAAQAGFVDALLKKVSIMPAGSAVADDEKFLSTYNNIALGAVATVSTATEDLNREMQQAAQQERIREAQLRIANDNAATVSALGVAAAGQETQAASTRSVFTDTSLTEARVARDTRFDVTDSSAAEIRTNAGIIAGAFKDSIRSKPVEGFNPDDLSHDRELRKQATIIAKTFEPVLSRLAEGSTGRTLMLQMLGQRAALYVSEMDVLREPAFDGSDKILKKGAVISAGAIIGGGTTNLCPLEQDATTRGRKLRCSDGQELEINGNLFIPPSLKSPGVGNEARCQQTIEAIAHNRDKVQAIHDAVAAPSVEKIRETIASEAREVEARERTASSTAASKSAEAKLAAERAEIARAETAAVAALASSAAKRAEEASARTARVDAEAKEAERIALRAKSLAKLTAEENISAARKAEDAAARAESRETERIAARKAISDPIIKGLQERLQKDAKGGLFTRKRWNATKIDLTPEQALNAATRIYEELKPLYDAAKDPSKVTEVLSQRATNQAHKWRDANGVDVAGLLVEGARSGDTQYWKLNKPIIECKDGTKFNIDIDDFKSEAEAKFLSVVAQPTDSEKRIIEAKTVADQAQIVAMEKSEAATRAAAARVAAEAQKVAMATMLAEETASAAREEKVALDMVVKAQEVAKAQTTAEAVAQAAAQAAAQAEAEKVRAESDVRTSPSLGLLEDPRIIDAQARAALLTPGARIGLASAVIEEVLGGIKPVDRLQERSAAANGVVNVEPGAGNGRSDAVRLDATRSISPAAGASEEKHAMSSAVLAEAGRAMVTPRQAREQASAQASAAPPGLEPARGETELGL